MPRQHKEHHHWNNQLFPATENEVDKEHANSIYFALVRHQPEGSRVELMARSVPGAQREALRRAREIGGTGGDILLLQRKDPGSIQIFTIATSILSSGQWVFEPWVSATEKNQVVMANTKRTKRWGDR